MTNNRYDDFDTEFEPSKDKFSKHILGYIIQSKILERQMGKHLLL